MSEVIKKTPSFFSVRKHPLLWVTCFFTLVAMGYWGFLASDRYVSEAHVIIQQADIVAGQSMDIGSLLGGVSSGNQADQLLLRDHLMSVDMLRKLDEKLSLKDHYSNDQWDVLSRLWIENDSIENFHQYYLSRVEVVFDDYAGVLVIKSQAYEPKMAYAITRLLVEEGERFMNGLARDLAYEQVSFLEKQVDKMSARVMQARQAVLSFQNKKGLVSPQNTAENFAEIINRMEGQLAEMQTRRVAMLGYLMPKSSNMIELDLQIKAVKKQIKTEKSRLTSPSGKTLNKTVEEYQRLQLTAEFSQDVYQTTLVAMEKGRIEASRTLKKMSMLQTPTLPEYPLKPRRLYNMVVFVLVILLISGIMSLLGAVIRDHKE